MTFFCDFVLFSVYAGFWVLIAFLCVYLPFPALFRLVYARPYKRAFAHIYACESECKCARACQNYFYFFDKNFSKIFVHNRGLTSGTGFLAMREVILASPVILPYGSYICLWQVILLSLFAVVVRVDFSPSVTSCHLPRQMEAFFGGSKPTALHFSYIGFASYIAYGSYICLWQVILLTLFAVVV